MSQELELVEKTCANNHQTFCEKIGEINRFGKTKSFDCICYMVTEHKRKHNPTFNLKDHCKVCLIEIIRRQSQGTR